MNDQSDYRYDYEDNDDTDGNESDENCFEVEDTLRQAQEKNDEKEIKDHLKAVTSYTESSKVAITKKERAIRAGTTKQNMDVSISRFENKGTKQVIFHIDVDCFYCACERIRNPSLIGKPLAIIQNNSGGFVSVSYEAKSKGVRKGDGIGEGGMKNLSFFASRQDSSMKDVKKRCPDLIVLPMDIIFYRSISESVEDHLIDVFGEEKVERHSIDDFYIDVTALLKIFEHPLTLDFKNIKLPLFDKLRQLLDDVNWNDENSFKTWFADGSSNHDGNAYAELNVTGIESSFKDEGNTYPEFFELHSPKRRPNSTKINPGWLSQNHKAASRLAYLIRKYINRVTNGITLSCGIGQNKFVARMATDLHKPNGQTIVVPDLTEPFLATLLIFKVPGLKSAKGKELIDLIQSYWLTLTPMELERTKSSVSSAKTDFDCNHLIAIRTVPKKLILDKFGAAVSKKILEFAYGQDSSAVQKKKVPNQIMTEISFPIGKVANVDGLKKKIIQPLLKEVTQRSNNHFLKASRYPTLLHLKYRLKYASKLNVITVAVPSCISELIRSSHPIMPSPFSHYHYGKDSTNNGPTLNGKEKIEEKEKERQEEIVEKKDRQEEMVERREKISERRKRQESTPTETQGGGIVKVKGQDDNEDGDEDKSLLKTSTREDQTNILPETLDQAIQFCSKLLEEQLHKIRTKGSPIVSKDSSNNSDSTLTSLTRIMIVFSSFRYQTSVISSSTNSLSVGRKKKESQNLAMYFKDKQHKNVQNIKLKSGQEKNEKREKNSLLPILQVKDKTQAWPTMKEFPNEAEKLLHDNENVHSTSTDLSSIFQSCHKRRQEKKREYQQVAPRTKTIIAVNLLSDQDENENENEEKQERSSHEPQITRRFATRKKTKEKKKEVEEVIITKVVESVSGSESESVLETKSSTKRQRLTAFFKSSAK